VSYADVVGARDAMRSKLPQPMMGLALLNYVKEHARPEPTKTQDRPYRNVMLQGHFCGFWRVTSPLTAFKKVYGPLSHGAIVNLILPVGAKFYAPSCVWNHTSSRGGRKMRANRAVTHSIALIHNGEGLKDARSSFDKDYVYAPGIVARPKPHFSSAYDQCDPGIHFFLNVVEAFDY
jgi:hypothetical protein